MTKEDFEAFFQGYLECALWSSTDESDESGGKPLDANYTVDDITKKSLATMKRECKDFLSYIDRDTHGGGWRSVGTILANLSHYSWARAGHDFWLTRNGHGAGFWDRGLGEAGKRLTKAAKTFGESDLYVSRGKVHVL